MKVKSPHRAFAGRSVESYHKCREASLKVWAIPPLVRSYSDERVLLLVFW